uniref:Uncharacterized protein n=1 Tax=Anguilla anguilla TaxID=7936 RepID=A0A0E9TEV1_ANGAN
MARKNSLMGRNLGTREEPC